ncbi:MAG: hypothetical protein KKH98_16190, partial [Spirochaetes bacterium]|nr:hypothetical protein [Spirochaetota bacterium]
MKGSYMHKITAIILFVLIPFSVHAGLQIISDFESIYTDHWLETYPEGAGTGSNYVVTSDKFYNGACIEFRGDNIGGGGGMTDKMLWKWINATEMSWANYSRFIIAFKPVNAYLVGSDNNNLNFGLSVKEPAGDTSGWKGEVWEYYITNHNLVTNNSWYLWESDITSSGFDGRTNEWPNGWNTRFNKWRDVSYDGESNNNAFPPTGLREIDLFYKSASADLDDQKVRLDFMAVLSTPQPTVARVTNFYPLTLNWADPAPNHPVFNIMIYTNTNAAPVSSTLVTDAESKTSALINAHDQNLKPFTKYAWRIQSGYIVTPPSGAFNKYTISKTMVSGITTTTLWSGLSSVAYFTNNGIKPLSSCF